MQSRDNSTIIAPIRLYYFIHVWNTFICAAKVYWAWKLLLCVCLWNSFFIMNLFAWVYAVCMYVCIYWVRGYWMCLRLSPKNDSQNVSNQAEKFAEHVNNCIYNHFTINKYKMKQLILYEVLGGGYLLLLTRPKQQMKLAEG